MTPRKNIVWDVGNVLINWEPRLVYTDAFATDAEIDAFLEEIGFAEWNLEQDRGRTWEEGVAAKAAEHPHHAPLIARFNTKWADSVPGEIEGSVEILNAMRRAGTPTYGITNFSAEKWAESCERFDFLNGFKDVVVSAHERLVKPDPAIFNRFLHRNGLSATDCLFIDDSAANIASAKAIGFDTIRFENPGQLKRALAGSGDFGMTSVTAPAASRAIVAYTGAGIADGWPRSVLLPVTAPSRCSA